MSDVEKNLKIVSDGRMSALAAEYVGELIHVFKTKKLAELSQNFRAGKVDQPTLLASVAGLCALEDLENEMKRRMNRSEKAINEMNSRSSDNEPRPA